MASRIEDHDVVITGAGAVTPFGLGIEALEVAISQGKSAVRTIEERREAGFPAPIGASVPTFDAKAFVAQRKSLKLMCQEIQFAVAAASMSVTASRLDTNAIDAERFGVVFGSEMFYSELGELESIYRSCLVDGEFDFDRWGVRFSADLFPLWLLKYLPNMPACHISINHDAQGPTNSIVQGDASGSMALIEAFHTIRRGRADVMIAGGTGSRLHPTVLIYRGDSNLSHRLDAPEAASRPFDVHRDGMVCGEGCGAFVVERRAHAIGRGAPILGRILGTGMSTDLIAPGQPRSGAGIRLAIQMALRNANVMTSDLAFVSAHGASTQLDDLVEGEAIFDCVGAVPVVGFKSYFGNLGAGTGVVEMATTLASLRNQQMPPTLNCETPDERCRVNVSFSPRQISKRIALVLSQSCGTGQSTAIVVEAE